MRVLAIDDNADNLLSVTALLRGFLPGCQTATARSGPEGIALAKSFEPDLILLDIQMPGMDGYEVCQSLKASADTRHIPVVFLTALSATSKSRTRALECGGDAFLSKPVEPSELVAQARAMLRIKVAEDRLRDENRTLGKAVAEQTFALAESRRLLAAIVEGTPDAIWVKDRGGRFLLANEAALRSFNRALGEVLGHTAAEFLGPANVALHEEGDRRVLETGETYTQEERTTAGVRLRTFLATRGPIRDAAGEVTGVFGVVRDISERARARVVLQKETERVQALLGLYREPGQSAADVLRAAVEAMTRLTGSDLGLVGIPEPGYATLQAQLWSSPPSGGEDEPSRALSVEVRAADLWSEALLSGQPAVYNDEPAAARHRFVEGAPAPRRLLTVPVVRDGRVVLVGGVANREEPYGELDVAQAGLYLEGAWEALQKVRAEEQRTALEQQLRQAAKMEAVGRLAGGVAHDFNNLLSVILSYSRFALESLDPSDPIRGDIEEIRRAGERAAALTRQLLAHSRKQVFQVALLDLNQVVTGLEPMLRRLLGEDLDLRLEFEPSLWPVRADRGQVEQVVVNLAVNARDAMPQGGRLTIRTGNLPAGPKRGEALGSGPCVLLEVSDTGVGMDDATRLRLFEPFFTTKGTGQGTGLGLATVYGIVRQSGGDVAVESVPGSGSTFRVLLPRDAADSSGVEAPGPEQATRSAVARAGGRPTILLVEDEEAVRAAAERILSNAGYRVLTAASGAEALQLFAASPHPVELLLTDVVMPQMSGRALAQQLTALRPELKVAYMSGYLDDILGQHGVLPADLKFIGKPFAAPELTRLVTEVLGGAATGPLAPPPRYTAPP